MASTVSSASWHWAITAGKACDESASNLGIGEIKGDGVVDDARQPGRRTCPVARPADAVEPGVQMEIAPIIVVPYLF
jgi:hypothetical protein